MAKAFTTWTVVPHEPVQKLTENLWTVRRFPSWRPTRNCAGSSSRTGAAITDGAPEVLRGVAAALA